MTEKESILKFTSSRFGDLEIPEERVITSQEGIIGFPEQKRYVLLDPSGGQSVFLWLQSVENPELAFVVTDPKAFKPEYEIGGDEPDLERLGLLEKSSPALFVIVTVPTNDPDRINANLLAPLLYFDKEKELYQVVLERSDWPLRAFLLSQEEIPGDETQSSGEVQ